MITFDLNAVITELQEVQGSMAKIHGTIRVHAEEFCNAWTKDIPKVQVTWMVFAIKSQAIALRNFIRGIIPEKESAPLWPLFNAVIQLADERIKQITESAPKQAEYNRHTAGVGHAY